MTAGEKLKNITQIKSNILCIGLDTDTSLLPSCFKNTVEDVLAFNHAIIEATAHVASAYKINTAFYEQHGSKGWEILEKTRALLPSDALSIADAKRGDIGNTNKAYSRAFYQNLDFDAATVSPYLGFDTAEAFLQYPNKLTFVLALTSNPGSADFQRLQFEGKPLYRKVIERFSQCATYSEVGFVVGATHPADLAEIRTYTSAVLLIPGVGTQGGNPTEVMIANGKHPAIVNVSRQILYASPNYDFAEHASKKAEQFAALLQI